ncbi:MAG: hypothetical protein AVDCRST_MAG42-868 [uncultured Chthoniobacterales bacterium]|uniref:Uncharacterized protein n=1 Tax=uncultured Chthoniobacterales bacterium TaxID=1836801 RepID=A0A6J4HNF4_9BACT|nr:MAG: hypothetical protein AVDCRST_MAG42-868 [uncultured Chthoniobacterales bacterium]
MPTPDAKNAVGYYFALPRLVASWRGRSFGRSEHNAVEAYTVGGLVHAVTFIFAAELLLGGRPAWQQILLLIPLALLVWAWWSLFFYMGLLLLNVLRGAGVMRDTPASRAQSLFVGITTTLLAWHLITAGSWTSVLGWIWMIAVALNLAAAALLTLAHADPAR